MFWKHPKEATYIVYSIVSRNESIGPSTLKEKPMVLEQKCGKLKTSKALDPVEALL